MKNQIVAAWLVGVLIFSPGCYPWASGTDQRRIAVSRRIEAWPPPPTDAERGELYKGIGGVAAGSGAVLFFFYSLHEMGAPEEAKENVKGSLYAGLGLLAVGGLLWCHGAALTHLGSKRTEFGVAPNGCRFTYRF